MSFRDNGVTVRAGEASWHLLLLNSERTVPAVVIPQVVAMPGVVPVLPQAVVPQVVVLAQSALTYSRR